MPVTTISVGTAVTPTVLSTLLSHYFNRQPLHQKPTAHISYHEGLELIRRFLHYASFHTVEELQAFTSQWVPVPRWVHVKEVDITDAQLSRSADYVNAQLGPQGVKAVGGETWWQWRREGAKMKAEWIEMRKDYDARKQLNIPKGDRIMLYVHGGAYFFNSVDAHRYQLQRHARKLKARVIAPRYRLAPQFPFPCGLYDCLAVYLHLLEEKHNPNTILLAGDSAGGGMVLSMLVIIRDQGIPLPAGAILVSPWVDLTHSFPSLSGDGSLDYIPAHGFVHKPSISWPPPNADDLSDFKHSQGTSQKASETPISRKEDREAEKEAKAERVRGFSLRSTDQPKITDILATSKPDQEDNTWISPEGKYSISASSMLSVQLDDDFRVEIKDQIQMYAANHLLTHPLVSPALQPSLGGLPPLLVQSGGGELLRDEQIYIAHKAAQPLAYLPPPSNNQTAEDIQGQAQNHKPTNVQLQVWDDLCHVGPTLSFTRPAKHMYRGIAQFGAWALARAQKTTIEIDDDDDISFISSGSSEASDSGEPMSAQATHARDAPATNTTKLESSAKRAVSVGRAGDPLPPFQHHMIRQRIDRNGRIYALPAKEELVALNLPTADIGVPKTGPLSKWMKAQQQWNNKFAKQKIKIQKQRLQDMQKGFEGFPNELPPPTALAGRRVKGMKAEKAKKRSWGLSIWSGWGSSHDEATIVREEKADQSSEQPDSSTALLSTEKPPIDDTKEDQQTSKPRRRRTGKLGSPSPSRLRSHSAVTDQGQVKSSFEQLPSFMSQYPARSSHLTPGIVISDHPDSPATLIPATEGTSTRPTKGGVAYPFSLKVGGTGKDDANASTLTLQSMEVATPPAVEVAQTEKELHSVAASANLSTENLPEDAIGERERPSVDRFYTATPGAGLFGTGVQANQERPAVERFETAQEDLNMSTVAKGKP